MMKTWLKKIIVVLPVIIISLFYLSALYHETYSGASFKRIAGLFLSTALFYLCVIYITIRKRQNTIFHILVQSSFFVYLFAVLQLTGYFILFREVSSHGWWDNMNHRIHTHDHVNLTPFKTMDIYNTFDKQIAGNFIMLLPLGTYLPILFKGLRKLSGFFTVLLISFLLSVGIEILQLATNYRSTDVDDVFLNTLGACAGFLIFLAAKTLVVGRRELKEA